MADMTVAQHLADMGVPAAPAPELAGNACPGVGTRAAFTIADGERGGIGVCRSCNRIVGVDVIGSATDHLDGIGF